MSVRHTLDIGKEGIFGDTHLILYKSERSEESLSQISACCPTRVDLAGGTVDLWPIFLCLKKSTTVNFAIDLPAQAVVSASSNSQYAVISDDQDVRLHGSFEEIAASTHLPLHRVFLQHFWEPSLGAIHIRTSAKSPAGAGLGGSSSLAVATLAAILRLRSKRGSPLDYGEELLVQWVQNSEASLIKSPTGCQDYWAAVRGGANVIQYGPRGACVESIRSEPLSKLQSMLVVCYSGTSRFSGLNNWSVYKRFFDQDLATINAFEAIGDFAENCASALQKGDVEAALQCSFNEWRVRKEMWPDVETDVTRHIEAAGLKAGAWFGRICGAGGGGAMMFAIPPEKRQEVETAIQGAGATLLPNEVAKEGLVINEIS